MKPILFVLFASAVFAQPQRPTPQPLWPDGAPGAQGSADVDIPTLPNFFGPRDIGAYEMQLTCSRAVDTIYCDGFED